MNSLKIDCPGYSISADWYEGATTDEVILFLMGFTSTRRKQQELAESLVQNTGRSLLAIDYTGHGDSPFDLKDTRPAQHLLEAIISYDWIKSHDPNAKISIVSASYGAFLAVHLIQYRAVEQLVLRAPAIYPPEAFYDQWKKRLENQEQYGVAVKAYRQDTPALQAHPILEKAIQFAGKTLVVIHSNDELIPKEVTDVYVKAFSADQYIAKGFKHAVSSSNPTEAQMIEYQDAISNWLNED